MDRDKQDWGDPSFFPLSLFELDGHKPKPEAGGGCETTMRLSLTLSLSLSLFIPLTFLLPAKWPNEANIALPGSSLYHFICPVQGLMTTTRRRRKGGIRYR